jgi:hydrogenase maturation protease
MADPTKTVLVIGTGNELLGDEGLGVHVARALLARDGLPEHVEVLEAGTALLDLLPHMSRYPQVILVDAVRAGQEPGSLYRLEIVAGSALQPVSYPPVSLHEWGILETLHAAETLGLMPGQLTLLGAEPEIVEPSLELSPRLARAAAQIVALLLDEVTRGAEKYTVNASSQ